MAHARLHDRDAMKAEGVAKSAQQKELEAESIAYTVMFHYHMDTSGYSIPYLASWSGSQDTKQLKACMDTIRRTAGEIIEEMDAFMAERMKELATEKSAEQDTDRYTIYQIREGSPAGVFEFMGMDYIRQKGMEIRPEDYQEVYVGALVPGTTLEDLYIQFNGPKMPEDFTGHSLSVSDIVVVHKDGEDHAYYVDRFGYEEVPEFLAPVQAQEKAAHEITAETESKPADAEKSEATRADTIIPEKVDTAAKKTVEAARTSPSKDVSQPVRRKESVLGRLGEKQRQIKAAERAKPEMPERQKAQAVKRGKGEQAL